MNEFLLVAGMALATMATRIPVLWWLSLHLLSPGIARALKYVPLAVLSAIIAPIVLLSDGKLAFQVDNAPLIASLVAIFISWRTRSLLLTILLGMAVLLGWRALFAP
ncbi:MAG TPA: AzlD domain-containing protein [Anaerolineales bacterium]|nr:AzlD domain-containing protein [Anaerolineales bacterium]